MRLGTWIKVFGILLVGVGLGYYWSYQSYQPLRMAQQIKDLQTDVDNCEHRWVRDFSRKHGLIEEVGP